MTESDPLTGEFHYADPAGQECVDYGTGVRTAEAAEPGEPDIAPGWGSILTSAGKAVYFEKIVFPSFDGLSIPAYVYKPAGPGPFPGALMIHGGRHGVSLSRRGADRAERMAGAGYVVMQVDYRSSASHGLAFRNAPTVDGQARQDCVVAGERLAALSYVDADRLVVRGFSRGGNLSARTVQHTERFKAAAMWCGTYASVPRVREGETTEDAEVRWRKFSPTANAAKTTGRLLILHSIEDDVLGPERAVEFADALMRAGKEYTLVMLHDAGHGAKDPAQMEKAEGIIMAHFAAALCEASGA